MSQYRSAYVGNFRGIGRMLQRPGMLRVVISTAREMEAVARRNSPVGAFPDDPHPGLYQRSFQIRYGAKDVKFRGKSLIRPYGRLVNVAPHAHIVEYGNARVPRYAPIRKTIDDMKAGHGAP